MKTMAGLDRHPLNSDGPFYVENGQCISCGAPEMETDGLMTHNAEGHCFFMRQPLTDDETNAAIRGVRPVVAALSDMVATIHKS